MKLFSFSKTLAISAMVLLAACTKDGVPEVVNEPAPVPSGGTILRTGGFISNAHPTTGTARYIIGTDNKRYLRFENFRTDNGPDLRVYLSRGPNLTDAREVGRLKAASGNFSYELAGHLDPLNYNYVLVWCVPFSVLFGHAVLR